MIAVALVVALLLAAETAAAQDRLPLTLSSAAADEGSGTLTIEGSGFGARPFVTLNLVPLPSASRSTRASSYPHRSASCRRASTPDSQPRAVVR